MPDNEQTIQDAQMSSYLGNIASAVYGRQVRDSIVNAITKCYLDTSTSKTLAEDKIAEVTSKLGEINSTMGDVNEAYENLLTAIEQSEDLLEDVEEAMSSAIDDNASTVSEVNAYLNIYGEGE